jgi:hypothetical protein
MPRARLTVTLLLLALAARIDAQAPLLEGYETIGEGLTAAVAGGRIEYGWRLFTIYTMDDACRRSHAEDVARLRHDGARLITRIGRPFPPAQLKIVALDNAGRVVARVPVAVELKAPPRFFDSRLPDAPEGPAVPLGTGPLIPIATGTVTFRARTLCRGSAADVLVQFRTVR